MVRLRQNRYFIKNASSKWLREKGFLYNKAASDEESDIYTYRFPAYKYEKRIPVLDCELSVDTLNGEVTIEVVNAKSRSPYAPFYYDEYGDYDPLLEVINKVIKKEMSKLGIKRKKN